MKRWFLWLTIFALILIAFDNRESVEISERALVHAVGIDQSEEGVTVTLQIFKAGGSGSDTQIDLSKPNIFVISNTAPSFDEAMEKCESQMGKYLFIGHNQIIVLGSDASFDDPDKLLGYFIKNKDNYLGVPVVMAENTAKEIMEVQLTGRAIASENFTDVIEMYYQNGETVFSDMLHFINSIKSVDKSAVLPVVSIKQLSAGEQSGQSSDGSSQSESGSQQQSSQGSQSGSSASVQLITIEKSAVIGGGEFKRFINSDEIKGLNWLTDHMKETVINIASEEENTGVTVKKRSVKDKLVIRDNRLVYTADIDVDILTDTGILPGIGETTLKKLVTTKIEQDCTSAIDTAFYRYNSDCFDIAQLIKFYYPQIYLDYSDNYDALKETIDFEINVNCYIK